MLLLTFYVIIALLVTCVIMDLRSQARSSKLSSRARPLKAIWYLILVVVAEVLLLLHVA